MAEFLFFNIKLEKIVRLIKLCEGVVAYQLTTYILTYADDADDIALLGKSNEMIIQIGVLLIKTTEKVVLITKKWYT